MGQSKVTLHQHPAMPPPQVQEDDALSSFAAESDTSPYVPAPAWQAPGSARKVPYIAAAVGAVLIVAAATIAFVATRPASGRAAAAPVVASGIAFIDSRPQGAAIFIDGMAKGATPARIALTAGQHTLELKMDDAERSFPLIVEAGTTMTHYVELAASPVKPVVSTGRLDVASDPPGAQVTVDGAAKGRTPLTLADIQAGDHAVTISSSSETINRKVSVTAGNTASVFAALGGAAVTAAGWVAFKAPIELQIFEAKRLVGSTAVDRVMLPAGRHELELVNTELEFRKPVTVQVGAGTTVTPAVDLPNGSLSLNALPWAEVTIDGRAVGTTPLGNLTVPIGTYEIVWRHPQLGERRRTVKIPATTPVRVGVDLNQ